MRYAWAYAAIRLLAGMCVLIAAAEGVFSHG